MKQAKKKIKKTEQPEIKKQEVKQSPEIIEQPQGQGFEILDDLFHSHEDNYNEQQDAPLLQLIETLNSVNDKVKIKFLFKRYRDTARESFYKN